MIYVARMITTIAIWGIFASILIFAPNVTDNFLFVIVLAISMAVSTEKIWQVVPEVNGQGSSSHEKAKRIDKTERFLASLDDEELEALRQRLMAESDGEMVDLESLMRH
ncbi:MAG: hypothetical protein D6712_14235 [Chloroflexi bacterium]|nr:MAG: hypothetical protein D6712_14235 [Chloroflexota bacterium]